VAIQAEKRAAREYSLTENCQQFRRNGRRQPVCVGSPATHAGSAECGGENWSSGRQQPTAERIFTVQEFAGSEVIEPEEETKVLSFFEWAFHSRRPKYVKKLVQSYERRMRLFDLGVIVVALIVLTILIVWLSSDWMAFEKSLVR
jgi:hypothetical protein